MSALSDGPAGGFERVIRAGGVVLFPSDTVYGLACSPSEPAAIARLYALKRRPPEKAAAVMFFGVEAVFAAVGSLGPRLRAAIARLAPGAMTFLVPNPDALFPLACAGDMGTLGLRVVEVPALSGVTAPVMQSSANLSGGPDARRLADVPASIREGVDLVIDGGALPGVPSTVVDLRGYESGGEWAIVRQGAVPAEAIAAVLAALAA